VKEEEEGKTWLEEKDCKTLRIQFVIVTSSSDQLCCSFRRFRFGAGEKGGEWGGLLVTAHHYAAAVVGVAVAGPSDVVDPVDLFYSLQSFPSRFRRPESHHPFWY